MPIEHRVREALDAYMARVRHDMDAHLRGLTSDLLRLVTEHQDQWRTELERGAAEARADAERTFRSRLESARDELAREMEVRLARERADLQVAMAAAKGSERDTRLDTVERLLGAARKIDEATSLSSILEALIQGASAQTSRVAMLMVDGDHLTVWGHRGFTSGLAPTDMPIGASGTLAAAVAVRQSSFVPPLIDGRYHQTPAFMRVPVGFTGVVIPLVVGGDVVAVLYADDVDKTATQEDAPIWTEEVELLARHAAVCLENITSVRTVEVLARPN
jgi:hypothetical protein